MQKNYLIAGGAILLLALGFLLVKEDAPGAARGGEPLIPVSSFSHSHGIAVDVTDASKVYIATHEGLYLLKDDKDLYRIGETRDDLMGFNSHPTEANVFFSSGHPARGGNIGLQKTTDGGLSWERISAGLGGPVDFHAMAVSAANPDVIYGFFGGKLQRSQDGGRSWEYARGSIAPYSLSVDHTDKHTLYAATQNGVQISKDKGDAWANLSEELSGGAVSVFASHPQDNDYALAFSERLGGLGKSADGGVSWEKVNETFAGGTVLYLAFSKTEPDVVYALTNKNAIYKSADRGMAWVNVR
ncbi:hypothetical protein C4552_04060 [Candidatus Parcubacteria bacterium]|nr:MAG: hypothetical protein C4552_04060 [Candidatus Parcubacteria bacterium]